MGSKYEILAARYPFKGYYEASFQTNSFLSAIWNLRKYKKQGYEIIDMHCRDINEWKSVCWSLEDNRINFKTGGEET